MTQIAAICLSLPNGGVGYLPIPLVSMPNDETIIGVFIKVNKDCEGECSGSLLFGSIKIAEWNL